MKIAVSAQQPTLQSPVGQRLGTSAYLIFLDTQTMAFEAVPNPAAADQRASGLQAVVLAIDADPPIPWAAALKILARPLLIVGAGEPEGMEGFLQTPRK